MARSLLKSSQISTVTGYDLSLSLTTEFHKEASYANKNLLQSIPHTLKDTVIPNETNVVILVLVNERQCNQICFGSNDEDSNESTNLYHLLQPKSCVILCSTVSASWCIQAYQQFKSIDVQFIDCPISGGPIRALAGELTLMVSGQPDSIDYIRPILDAMGKEIHIVPGGVGYGSTAKMVHQLLAGVHIVVAAEGLALAAKAGLDVRQMYDIVKGAAGNSWMFSDRGTRMINGSKDEEQNDVVRSALSIFVKDLDIVHSEAKRLQCPIPLASVALQQFISGVSLGLSNKDDSQVVQVYEALSGVSVSKDSNMSTIPVSNDENNRKTEGNEVGDVWILEDGTHEEILEVGSEPRHNIIISNEFTRVLKVSFPSKDTTVAHRHAEDSLYFFLVPNGLSVINHVKGSDPVCDCMDFGEVRYGTHKSDKPLIHKITNTTDHTMLCIDAEVLKSPPISCPIPLVAQHHTLIKSRDKCRVYKLCLQPGESVTVTYPFFYLSVVLKGTLINVKMGNHPHFISWDWKSELGDVEWKSPSVEMTLSNSTSDIFEQYIAEWI
jgi:putative dehydrogenase